MSKKIECIEKADNTEIEIESKVIQNLVYVVRGKQIMLDCDLADLYQIETSNLNKARKRNEKDFQKIFVFN